MFNATAIVNVLLDAEEFEPPAPDPTIEPSDPDADIRGTIERATTGPYTFYVPQVAEHVYRSFDAQLKGRQHRKLENHTYLFKHLDSGDITIRYHNTDIISVSPDGTIEVTNGGYKTPSTKNRINSYLPHDWRIYLYNDKWWWANSKTRLGYWDHPNHLMVPFTNHDQILPNGHLRAQRQPQYPHRKSERSQL
jgi:hypothetical protein